MCVKELNWNNDDEYALRFYEKILGYDYKNIQHQKDLALLYEELEKTYPNSLIIKRFGLEF